MIHMSKHKKILAPLFAILFLAGIVFLGQQKEETVTQPERVTLTGEAVCLPHRAEGDFHTLECAFGLKVGELYYGINTALSSDINILRDFQTGSEVTISGPFIERERDESGLSEKYKIEGVVWVTSVN